MNTFYFLRLENPFVHWWSKIEQRKYAIINGKHLWFNNKCNTHRISCFYREFPWPWFFFLFFFFPPSLSNSLTIYFDWKFYIEDITINLICNNFPCERSNFNFIKFFTTNKRFWKFESIKKGCNFCFKKCFIVKRFARYSEKYVFQSWMIVEEKWSIFFENFFQIILS